MIQTEQIDLSPVNRKISSRSEPHDRTDTKHLVSKVWYLIGIAVKYVSPFEREVYFATREFSGEEQSLLLCVMDGFRFSSLSIRSNLSRYIPSLFTKHNKQKID